jgi:hypothetical protein
MGAHVRPKKRCATIVLGGPGVLKWSSGSSSDASRAFRFRRPLVAARPRVVICEGVSTDSSSMASTEVPRSVLMRLPACDSLSAATVSVCDKIDGLLLRSRTDPPAREDARLPGLVRLGATLRRDRPDRVSGSTAESSGRDSVGVSGSGAESPAGTASISFSLPLPFALDFRGAFAFGGLGLGDPETTKSVMASTVGRGLPATGVPAKLRDFHPVLAETGVAMALRGEREFIGVEKDCRA